MSKIAFVFPGQGAQYMGMGRDFYEQIPESRQIFEEASRVCGLDLPDLCFSQPEKIHITKYTQIAMLTTEAAILAAVRAGGLQPDVTAGLSLGEYGALVAAGVLSFADAARVVQKRGLYMQEAVPVGGAMSAVLGLSAEAVEKVLQELQKPVTIANYNCPGQLVITGTEEGVQAAGAALQDAGAKRIVPLKVSGPFHSPLLKQAGEQLSRVLAEVSVQPCTVPYVSNVTADYVREPYAVRGLLEQQVASPVRWQQSVERMLADGANTFVEIGPGHTLTGFLKKISREAVGITIEKAEDLEKLETVKR